MEKEFIPYQEALELKALGFDELCFTYYKNDQLSDILELVKNSEMENVNNEVHDYISASTFSQSFRFFRDKYNLHSHVSLGISDEQDKSGSEYDEYTFVIEGINGIDYDNYGNEFFTNNYEEAELACLRKLIEIVKSK